MDDNFNHLLVRKDGETAWVTINRIADRNSINSALMLEIHQVLESLENDDVRAVVFSGGGETYFIGGADGIEMMGLTPEQAHGFSVRIQGLFNRLEASPLITVAAINGLCFGGGFEFALACDLRVAESRARIGLPEVKVGLIPGGGGTQRLPRTIGLGKAMPLILSGRLVKAREAEQLGLIHLMVENDDLKQAVETLLEPIFRQPRYAVSLAKQATQAFAKGDLSFGLATESERFSRCFERTFFPDLMRQQVADGVLTTSENVPSGRNDG